MLGAGCQKSSATAPDASAPPAAPAAAPGVSAWGVLLHVPETFSAEQNQAAGWEVTDGKVVMLLGRHDLEPKRDLAEFFRERRQALGQFGAVELSIAKRRKLEQGEGLEAEGGAESDGGSVGLKLFVARIDAHSGLSLLMIHEPGEKAHAKAAWHAVLSRSRLP